MFVLLAPGNFNPPSHPNNNGQDMANNLQQRILQLFYQYSITEVD